MIIVWVSNAELREISLGGLTAALGRMEAGKKGGKEEGKEGGKHHLNLLETCPYPCPEDS